MPTLGNALDFAKYEGRQFRAHQLGAAPSSPVTGQLYYNTADNTLYWWDGTQWIPAKAGAGTPTGPAGGDLTGTYPNPQIAAGVITDADVNAANKDGAAATASMRTLGTGANQAAPGNDSRFGAPSPPNGAAGGDLSGTYPNPQIAALAIVDGDVAVANKDGAVGTYSMRTLGSGAQQAMPGNRTLDAINNPVAPRAMNGQRISGMADGTSATDAVTKQQLDAVVAGLDVKASCRAATTANISLSAPGATIDGVTMAAGERVLVKNQTAGETNGIYVWNGAAVAMNRSTDADISAEVTAGLFTFVSEGTTNADSGWYLTTNNPIVLNTTPLVFVQFSGAGQITGGAGLLKTGNTLDVGAGTGISVAADTVGLVVPVSVANGGTGGTTPATSRAALGAAGYYSSATHAATASWSITAATHGLGAKRGIQVQVQDEATGAVEYPDAVVAATGDVTITYGTAPTANSKRVTLVG
jgi:hypothetical protein